MNMYELMSTVQKMIDRAFSELASDALEQDVRPDQVISYFLGLRDMRDALTFDMNKLEKEMREKDELQQDDH